MIKSPSLQSLKKFKHDSTMGKGDKRTKKGKIIMGSYGNSRPHKPQKQKAAKGKTIKKD